MSALFLKNLGRTRPENGFTIIELMVVVGVTITLTSMALIFGNPSRQNLVLSVEQAKLSQVILRAKSLAISTYNQPPVPCGYGVAIDYGSNSYSIFRYEKYNPGKKTKNCGGINQILTSITCPPYVEADPPYGGSLPPHCYKDEETYVLPPGISFDGSVEDPLDYVFFRPPDPATLLFPNPDLNPPQKNITLSNSMGSRSIIVNSVGQLSFR